jgi:hypothetical protein
MKEFEQNLISMMVEETMNTASVHTVGYSSQKSCYQLSFHGYLFEIPSNWSSLVHGNSGEILLPEDFIQILNLEMSCQFEAISIIAIGNGEYSLDIKSAEHMMDSMPKAA